MPDNRSLCLEVLLQAKSARIGVEVEVDNPQGAVQWLNRVKREEGMTGVQIRLMGDKIWITRGKDGSDS